MLNYRLGTIELYNLNGVGVLTLVPVGASREHHEAMGRREMGRSKGTSSTPFSAAPTR
jgi:hypothetical protein